ncbi:MAG: hypothetical protein KAS32_23565 [Candidatus Peribacteraceae bacterium]|nr:hypothetical protein [Candidatus Peribacteraceae bacterium]
MDWVISSLHQDDGNILYTGRKETWFQIVATIDLCKCGDNSAIRDIDCVNKDESHHWFWFENDGNTQTTEDRYGDKLKPVPINVVIQALKQDVKTDNYRRFKWALALLESMIDDKEKLSVLFNGHRILTRG